MCESNFKIEFVKVLSEDGQKSWWIIMDLGDFF